MNAGQGTVSRGTGCASDPSRDWAVPQSKGSERPAGRGREAARDGPSGPVTPRVPGLVPGENRSFSTEPFPPGRRTLCLGRFLPFFLRRETLGEKLFDCRRAFSVTAGGRSVPWPASSGVAIPRLPAAPDLRGLPAPEGSRPQRASRLATAPSLFHVKHALHTTGIRPRRGIRLRGPPSPAELSRPFSFARRFYLGSAPATPIISPPRVIRA